MSRPDALIIGAGPAGIAAAVQAVRLGLAVSLIDEQGRPGGLAMEAFCVENYPGLEPLAGPDLVSRLAQHLARFQVTVERARVLEIAPLPEGGYAVTTQSGIREGRTVIAAVGTRAKALTLPKIAAGLEREVFYEPSAALASGSISSATIVGGGEAAFDYALTLARSGAAVHLLVRSQCAKTVGRLARLVDECPAIEICLGARLVDAKKRHGLWQLDIERSGSTSTLESEALLAAVGRCSAAPSLLPGLDLSVATGITTPWPGLCVVGDARSGCLGQVGMAVGDGLAAAMHVLRICRMEARCRC